MNTLAKIEAPALDDVLDQYLAILRQFGVAEVVGGEEILDAGLQSLIKGLLPLAAELVSIEDQGRDLSDAVNDPSSAPYAAKAHGFLEDLLTQEVPAELRPWARKLAGMVPPPEATKLRAAVVTLALRARAPMARALGRFFVFEAICLRQRLELLASGVHLEALGGRRRDVEAIAERELALAEAAQGYGDELLDLDDPLAFIQKIGVLSLGDHVEALKRELAAMSREFVEVVHARREILTVMEKFDPRDALLIRNRTAAVFGEEELSAQQLQVRHPVHLADVSEAAIWKRIERLPGKVDKLRAGDGEAPSRGRPTLADVILEGMNEVTR